MLNNNTITSHESKIHGKIDFPYTVYMGRIPEFLKNYPLHWHEEFEIIYVMDGQIEIQVSSEKFLCNQCDIVIIPSGVLHKIQQVNNDKAFYFNILFRLNLLESDENSNIFKKYFLPLLSENGINNYIPSCTPLNYELAPIINRLITTRQKKYNNQELVIKSELFILMEKLQGVIKNDFPSHSKSSQISRLKPLITKISKDYAENITVKMAADMCAMSETYFMKFFKKMTGITFIEYVNSVRLDNAHKLLTETDKSISEIAEACGFNNFSYFIRTFKKHFGKTPKQIQKI